MKKCTICKRKIEPGQSHIGTGTGYAHLGCLYPKKVAIIKVRRPTLKGKGE